MDLEHGRDFYNLEQESGVNHVTITTTEDIGRNAQGMAASSAANRSRHPHQLLQQAQAPVGLSFNGGNHGLRSLRKMGGGICQAIGKPQSKHDVRHRTNRLLQMQKHRLGNHDNVPRTIAATADAGVSDVAVAGRGRLANRHFHSGIHVGLSMDGQMN